MKKSQLYIETSVWNFYFADDAPEKKDITLSFFLRIKNGEYDVFISNIVLDEINRANEHKRTRLSRLIEEVEPRLLIVDEQVINLANKYIAEGALPQNKVEDAIHAAVATIYEMDALISWNLKHLSNFKRMEMINGINMKEGYYKRLELITPMEVSDGEI